MRASEAEQAEEAANRRDYAIYVEYIELVRQTVEQYPGIEHRYLGLSRK